MENEPSRENFPFSHKTSCVHVGGRERVCLFSPSKLHRACFPYTVANKTHSEGIGNANAFVKRRHSIAMYCHFTQDRIMISMPFIIQCITQQNRRYYKPFLFQKALPMKKHHISFYFQHHLVFKAITL